MILIIADANETIGIGHVMRCLSIAHAFIRKGEDVLFIIADDRSKSLLSGFKYVCMNTLWSDVDGEIVQLLDIVKQYKPSLILIDSYFITKKYFQELSKMVPIAYIDDINTNCLFVDYLINYNIFFRSYDYSEYDIRETKLMLGPRYAPLRDEFKDLALRTTKKSVTDVLVSAGGSDPEMVTEKLIHAICPLWRKIRFHFIVGKLNPQICKIRKLENDNVILHIDEKHVSELMMNCDLAIAASGFTLYELCATGVPTIAYTLADNQIIAAEQFEKQGFMLSAGDCKNTIDFISRVKTHMHIMINDYSMRMELSNRMQRLVDGNGADRVADVILAQN